MKKFYLVLMVAILAVAVLALPKFSQRGALRDGPGYIEFASYEAVNPVKLEPVSLRPAPQPAKRDTQPAAPPVAAAVSSAAVKKASPPKESVEALEAANLRIVPSMNEDFEDYMEDAVAQTDR